MMQFDDDMKIDTSQLKLFGIADMKDFQKNGSNFFWGQPTPDGKKIIDLTNSTNDNIVAYDIDANGQVMLDVKNAEKKAFAPVEFERIERREDEDWKFTRPQIGWVQVYSDYSSQNQEREMLRCLGYKGSESMKSVNKVIERLEMYADLEYEQNYHFENVNAQDYVESLIDSGKKLDSFQKYVNVHAEQGVVGEKVTTIMKDGLTETTNVVKQDAKNGKPDWIVTNPNGERYVVPDSKFTARYDVEKAQDGVYPPKFEPINAIEIDRNIEFTAHWGEKMKIKKGGFLVVNSPDDIYEIQKQEFYETYMSLEKYQEMEKKNKKDKVLSDKYFEIHKEMMGY